MSLLRLQKVLAERGVASRRRAEELIREGRVRVNGTVITELGYKVDPERDRIEVDGKRIPPPPPRVYYLLYKPCGVITSLSDPQGRPTVRDLLRRVRLRVFPVGRLDRDAEGLLLLTNDGELAARLLHPRYRVPRVYQVKVRGVLGEGEVKRIREGVPLEDGPSPHMKVRLMRRTKSNTWLQITLHEGRNRVIKRTFAAIGHPVMKLRRVAFGPLNIKGLRPGEYRALRSEEIKRLKRWTAIQN